MMTQTQLARLGLFDARVPRYTSYPTAPHFSERVSEQTHRMWIGQIPQGAQISLYLHIPFCRRLCWFCACRTQGTASAAPVAAYLEDLKSELRLLQKTLPRGVTLSRLHWGGGTPTLLSPAQIIELAQAVFDVVPLSEQAEFSVEIDPNEIDAARLDALAGMGMNRASIGVQDFDPRIQETIGRPQGFDVTKHAVDMIRDRGIASLNADILFGLPHQNRARITETVQKLLSLSPDRVALYGYAHVPWMAKRQQMIPSDALPTPEARLALFETAQALFEWDGYRAIGIDHFARPEDGLATALAQGALRRNFQGYTDDPADVLIGLGASSISRFPQGFSQNAAATSRYSGIVRDGRFAVERGHVFAGEDQLRARLIEALMCDFAIDRAEILRRFDVSPKALQALFETAKAQFAEAVVIGEDGFVIVPAARALTRMIARCFDAYDMSKAGHSTAI